MLRSGSQILRLMMLLLLSVLTACGGQSASETLPTQAVLPTQAENAAPTAAPADGSVSSAVDALFTQTAAAQEQIGLTKTVDAMFVNAATATAAFDATVAAEFQQAVIATAQANRVAPIVAPLVFKTRTRDGMTINIVNSDGSDLRTLYSTKNQISNPRFSPDGQTIAFTEDNLSSGVSDTRYLSLINPDGTNHRQFANPVEAPSGPSAFIWSPDSRSILFITFTSSDNFTTRLYITEIATGETRDLAADPATKRGIQAQMNADSTTIVFDREGQIYTIPTEGGVETPITDSTITANFIDWISSAELALYLTNTDLAEADLWLQKQGDIPVNLHKVQTANIIVPRVAPNETLVAVLGKVPCANGNGCQISGQSQYELNVYDLNGTKLHSIVFATAEDVLPNGRPYTGNGIVWSQDSQYVAAQINGGIYVINIQAESARLLNQGHFVGYPWLPDMRNLLFQSEAVDEICTIEVTQILPPTCVSVGAPVDNFDMPSMLSTKWW